MSNTPAWLIDLLREARDTVQASTVEDGISATRKEYREDLCARLTRAYDMLRGPVPPGAIMDAALTNPQPKGG